MKKILLYIMTITALFSSCDDFLDTKSYTQKNSDNFPVNENDMFLSLVAVYSKLLPTSGEMGSTQIFCELLSDDRFGGGGSSDYSGLSINDFTIHEVNLYSNQWERLYQGIYRANYYIEQDAKAEISWSSEVIRQKYLGEAHFLRAWFLADAVRMFGNIPMPLSTEPENLPQAAPEVVYGQIASDIKKAIELLPATRWPGSDSDHGHANKWAAQAFMARVFLFYTGYHGKTDIDLPEGGKVTKSDVISWIDDCVDNSGYSLVPDFRNLWLYAESKDYKYTKDHNLAWVGNGKDNPEVMFATKFSAIGNTYQPLSSIQVLFYGWRNQNSVPFGYGWGFGTVNPQLYDEWPDDDLRKRASISYVDDKDTEGELYYRDNQWNQMQDTRMWAKKTMPVYEWPAAGPSFNTLGYPTNGVNVSVRLWGASTGVQNNNAMDQIEIRFADVLLMGAELGCARGQEYMDKVRTRVGLPSVPATLENIKLERRYELAFEGLRYWDIFRWNDEIETYAKINKVPCFNDGRAGHVTVRYRPELKGLMQIPHQEIVKSNGVLKQNEGWSENPNFDPNRVYNE